MLWVRSMPFQPRHTQLHWQISHKCPRTTTDGGLKRRCWLLHHSVPDSRFMLKCIKTAPTAGNSTPQKLHSTAQSLAERCWYLLYPLHKRNSAPWTGNNQLTLTISALRAVQRNWPKKVTRQTLKTQLFYLLAEFNPRWRKKNKGGETKDLVWQHPTLFSQDKALSMVSKLLQTEIEPLQHTKHEPVLAPAVHLEKFAVWGNIFLSFPILATTIYLSFSQGFWADLTVRSMWVTEWDGNRGKNYTVEL